jgi:sRNA-binding protein
VAGVTVRRALQLHCDGGKYLNMLTASAGKPRYHPLSGEIMGEVTAEEAAHAKSVMDERRAKRKAAKGGGKDHWIKNPDYQGYSVLAQPVQTGTVSTLNLGFNSQRKKALA